MDTPAPQSTAAVTQQNVVAIRMPIPDWTQAAVNDVKAKLKSQVGVLADIDTIKIRKSLNKNEDDFVQAVINHCLSVVDRKLQTYINDHQKNIISLLNNIKDMVSLEVVLSKFQKEKILEELNLCGKIFEIAFHIHESDLENLDEWKKFTSMSKTCSSTVTEVVDDQKDRYILRIAKRIHMELQTALDTYSSQSQVTLHPVLLPMECLGSLRGYRKHVLGVFIPNGSEGDYQRIGSRKEAYNEDTPNDYHFKLKKNYTILRQRTVKFQLNLHMDTFVLPESAELMKHVKCSESVSPQPIRKGY